MVSHTSLSRVPRGTILSWGLALSCLSCLPATPTRADDRQLLRFNTAKPYVFVLLDSSGSMALGPAGNALPGNGDDSSSKLYSAKQVLYNVFKDVQDVQFGFAHFNQDDLRVRAKHWLYTAGAAAPAGWPIQYPAAGESMVFGKHYELGTTGVAGACPAALGALSLTSQRTKLNRFAKIPVVDTNANGAIDMTDTNQPTTIYLYTGALALPTVYRLTVTRPALRLNGSLNANLGQDNVEVKLRLERLNNLGCGVLQTYGDAQINFRLDSRFPHGFLMSETDGPTAPVLPTDDDSNGYWNWSDSLQSGACGALHPFSGNGWEGNYDGTFSVPIPNGSPVGVNAGIVLTDPYACLPPSTPATCKNLLYPTTLELPQLLPLQLCGLNLGVNVTPLDHGDVMPFDWDNTQQDKILDRLAPNHNSAPPDFGVAGYYADLPDATGYLPLKNPNLIPLMASGPTGLGKALNDFRCWYEGPGNKCHNLSVYPPGGWSGLASCFDSEWGCRQTYLIVISDGADNCGGEDPCADTADLKSKGGITTYSIAYGADCTKAGNPIKCMASNGGSKEPICPADPSSLTQALNAILGQIREQTRAFASAAVPTVQANVADKIYLADFTPAAGSSTWEGHVQSFLKPLPLNPATGRPDTSKPCSSLPAAQQTSCFVWDAASSMLGQVPASGAPPDYLGSGPEQRRIFYSRFTASGSWSLARRPFDPTFNSTPQAIRYDLWRGFRESFQADSGAPATPDATAQDEVNAAILAAEALKTHTFTDPSGTSHTDTYILGDIFHSDPLIIGTPTNSAYFAADAGAAGNGANPVCTSGDNSTDRGYRCFMRRQENRRKIVLVGSNDGMLHAFDAGIPHLLGSPARLSFDNGTGKEVFAYVPRTVMPALRTIAQGTNQRWTVDGPPRAADVFIDSTSGGTPDPARRQWRTVAVTGLREGGRGYFALDLTQPDLLATTTASGATTFLPLPTGGYVPSCLGNPDDLANTAISGCGPTRYPAALWEFYDAAHTGDGSIALDAGGQPVLLDDDQNGVGDLGDTWSTPSLGRIHVSEDGATVDKYVAVFGGGLDPNTKTLQHPEAGDWLYIVDLETGKAIYKRQLEGCAPGGAAAVDTDQDGYLDRIYIGTTYGSMYRVDLLANAHQHFPALETVNPKGADAVTYTERRIVHDPDDPAAIAWAPVKIFNASTVAGVLQISPRSIYYAPSVAFVAKIGRYAISFATGDREDLWSADTQASRLYVFADDSDLLLPALLPLNEASLAPLTLPSVQLGTTVDYLVDRLVGQRGWYLALGSKERAITPVLTLLGLSTVSTYQPEICVGNLQPDGTCTASRDNLCSKTGTSKIFVTLAANGDAVLYDGAGASTRYLEEKTFVTPPYVEQAQTKNPSPGAQASGGNADQLTTELQRVLDALKSLYPQSCRFANYRQDIKTISGDTGVIFIAPVPICIVQKNWKEF